LPFLYRTVDDHAVDGRSDGGVRQVALRFCQRCLTAFVAAFRFLVIVDGLLVVGIADKLLFVQSPVAFVVLPLIFVFGFRTVVGGALGCHFALQGHTVHFGYELAFGNYGIVVGIYLVDDAAYLRADFHFRHRFDGAGGGYGFRYLAFDYGGCLVGHFMFGRGAAEKPDAYAGYRHNGYGDKDNLFLVHILYIIIGF